MDNNQTNEEQELEQSFSKVISTYEGRHLVMWLLQAGHFFDTSIPFKTPRDYWDGRRSLALEVYDQLLTVNPDTFTMCMKENKERVNRHDDRNIDD